MLITAAVGECVLFHCIFVCVCVCVCMVAVAISEYMCMCVWKKLSLILMDLIKNEAFAYSINVKWLLTMKIMTCGFILAIGDAPS